MGFTDMLGGGVSAEETAKFNKTIKSSLFCSLTMPPLSVIYT